MPVQNHRPARDPVRFLFEQAPALNAACEAGVLFVMDERTGEDRQLDCAREYFSPTGKPKHCG